MAEKRAGFHVIRDEVVKARTGESSQEWYKILDDWGMKESLLSLPKEKGHTLTAKHLEKEYGLSGWWSQCITIRYEWEKGLRTK